MLIKRQFNKFEVFGEFACGLSSLSTCRRKLTGAIVFPADFSEVLSIGYNGPASGVPNDFCTATEGSCGCAHAEANAIIKLHTHRLENYIFCTMSPCHACTNAIINCGQITKVIYMTPYRDTTCLQLFPYARIPVIQWSPDYAVFSKRWEAGSTY